ncbi:alpha/beta fold hydrolase [Paralcaligenes ginsengisoli]
MRKAVWAPQIAELSDRYQVIAYDMLGHGGSELPPEAPALSDYSSQLRDLLRHLGIRAAHIIGHSMGALVALDFALDYPRHVLSLVAMNAVYERSAEQSEAVMQRAQHIENTGPTGNCEATLERWFGQPANSVLRAGADSIRELLCQADVVGYARSYKLFAASDRAHSERLARLQCPALFMTGELDANSSPAMSRRMAQIAPEGEVEVLPGERHMMSITAPHEVNRRLRAFLDKAGQRPAWDGAQCATPPSRTIAF